ncbi:uncharacterized protein LACBIDRAFT_308550 [Laccaria bicolor S238N-H82]|uniref:Predicted protein n=1 Tax=Laccaria bicolor (strain S238N-H82 / ATCC MYA-4686) TaxID=486041 RepID=B0CWM5_LACBS|nr:uncharacterized protein LACBIDRAFT_308550 [Laccaria bicolor S238N-H82]EDR13094.1 predicted protein [Laccaria bicolor S238N-H82]|eukprot:XP_001875592.1 predicted protein [Laccaria bicolor S238N-H82]
MIHRHVRSAIHRRLRLAPYQLNLHGTSLSVATARMSRATVADEDKASDVVMPEVLQDDELRAAQALVDLRSSVTQLESPDTPTIPSPFAEAFQAQNHGSLSPDTPTIPSPFAQAFHTQDYSPPTSVFVGLHQHQYHTEDLPMVLSSRNTSPSPMSEFDIEGDSSESDNLAETMASLTERVQELSDSLQGLIECLARNEDEQPSRVMEIKIDGSTLCSIAFK